jgi:hypothetical protein
LLIFDNAEHPQDIADYRPDGPGHVLITSRSPGWGALGGRLEVDVLARAETIALLRARIPTLGEELAAQLAVELGDLPLAAAQAAGYLEQTDLPPADYLRRFRAHRASLLARGDVVGYHSRIDTTWALSLERLHDGDPAAVALLELAAFLAPDPIPLSLVGGHAKLLDGPLRATAVDPDALADTVGALVGYSLARRHPGGFQVHRLLQAVVRHRLAPDRQQAAAQQVVALLVAAYPGDPEDPAGWAGWAELAPHVLATAPLADHSLAGRHLALDTIRYLHAHGDSKAGRAIAQQLLDRWREVLGPDHPDTLTAASTLTLILFSVGEEEPGRALGEDTLERCRWMLGPDHTTTLWTGAALVGAFASVGEAERAHTLGQDTLHRCRRVLGPDHLATLFAAAGLTAALAQLGAAERARALGQDTLQLSRRVLGPDHVTSLGAAVALTGALLQVGEVESARTLGQDTLLRCRRVLGPDHLATLLAAAALTLALARLGEVEPARALGEDTLRRCRRVLGPEHPVTLYLTQATSSGLLLLDADAAEDHPSRPL